MLWPRIGQYVFSMLEKESVNNKGRDGVGGGGVVLVVVVSSILINVSLNRREVWV